MRNFLHSGNYVFLILLSCCCSMKAFPQTLASNQLFNKKPVLMEEESNQAGKNENLRSLKWVLSEISSRSSVTFNYNSDIVQNKYADVSTLQLNDLQQSLPRLLNSFGLSFEKVGEKQYVIYSKNDKRYFRKTKNETQIEAGRAENYSIVTTEPLSVLNELQFSVRGKVSDAAGALTGVSVKLKGTSIGTTTDPDGNYSLVIPDGTGTLVFTYIGYVTQEIPVNNRETANVTLVPENKALNEVVVVGYGSQKRSDITGAIVSVNEKSLRDVPAGNLGSILQGKAAGIDIQKSGGNSHPGSTPTILIRGTRSLKAGNGPLFVVDGIPFNGSINDLNPDDVVSVEVLKDASSTAIYGSRGANGVILITTKRGKSGKPVVTYSGYAGLTKNLGEYPIMNGPEFLDFKKWALINGRPGTYSGLDDPKFLTDGSFAPEEVEGIQSGRNTDWQKLIYKNGVTTNHQLGVAGGSDQTQYAVSAGYYDETGIYFGQSFERFSLKASFDQQLGKFIKVGVSSLNTYSIIKGENANPMGQALRASPLASPYDDSGNLINNFVPGSANQVWNPLADFLPGAAVETKSRYGTFTTAYLEASLLKGLKYRFNGGVEIRPETYGNFYASNTTDNLGGLSTGENRNTTGYDYTLENLLIYDKTFAEKHKLNFTGLFSLQESKDQSVTLNYSDVSADFLQYYNPQYGSNYITSGDYSKWDILSYMGRLNYGYDNRYLVTLTMRSDGSSRLAPGNKFHVFPSAAVAWNITNETFLKNSSAISNLKLRISYGTVGNSSINPYQTLGRLSPLTYNYGQQTTVGVYPTDAPNPELAWEYTSTLNAGLDFGFFRSRISGSLDLYHEYTNSLLLPQSLPKTSGIPNQILTNIGKTENKGIELALSTVNIEGKSRSSFSWSTDLNVAVNRGKITELASGVTQDIGNGWFVGQPLDVIYDYKKQGIWQNTAADSALAKGLGLSLSGTGSVIGNIRVADVNNDGKINADDRIIVGSTEPKFMGGITNRFGYKGFDFGVVAAFKVGGLINSTVHSGGFANTFQSNYNNLKADYWTPTNHENYYPKPNAANTRTPYNSLLGYFDGSYLKIRSLTLGYNLQPALIQKIGVKSLRVYATAYDAFILFSPYRNKYHGIDPESAGSLGVNTPATYSMTFGLNMTL